MDYFFRTTPDAGFTFNMHLVRLGLVLFLFVIYQFRKQDWLLKLLLVASVVLQGILYFWYTLDHDLWLLEGLPLYHCRIAGICLPIAFLLKKEKSMAFFADLALVGTLVAFAVPDPSKFAWPHVTNLTYILNHYVLMACGLLVTVNRPKSLTFKELGLASLAMNSVIFAIDLALGANYGYLTRVPIAFFDFVPVPLVFLIMTILIVIALYLVEILKKKFGTFAA
ncbi:YwaF family protein [Anaerococcus murdochii]|uniref:YwaF family protein n=1 Tax=Anaerococcus murdochii TaxID=411577 RepID=A0ABS7SYW5_9FIRM|nr:YwaF family protein [Anaerococcus murdochii]MBZ2386729.1 YwaF family protein [Anaerococcus murdochii]